MKIMNRMILILILFAVVLTVPYAASAQWNDNETETETETEETDAEEQPDEETLLSWPFTEDIDDIRDSYVSSLDPDGMIWYENEAGDITFISGDAFNTTVTDDEEAYSLAQNYMNNDDFDLQELRIDVFGEIIVYSYQQVYDNELIRNCYLKIITDRDGNILGVVDSLMNDPENALSDYSDSPEPADWEERFADWDTDFYETTLTSTTGEKVDASIPVMVDPDTGDRYLGDKERLIYCVHLSDLEDVDDRQESTPINMDRDLYSEGELLTYYRFIQVYDYFSDKGWWGPDGKRNPCMLQIDTSGESRGNASYSMFQDGFHTFNFGVDDMAGQSIQVIAHEFTHGVSATNHVGSYRNETGALDEALSDLIGNAVEADIRGWSPSENGWLNSFRQAHEYEYTLHVWDEFYTPPTDNPDGDNDYGDVHHNAYVISMLAWRMYETGMTPGEVFDYWFTFDLALTPKTDFGETGAKAAWCAEIAGLSEYAPVMQQAALDLRLNDKSLPDELPEHQGMIRFENPLNESNVLARFYDPWERYDFTTWPIAGTDTIAAVSSYGKCCMISVKSEDGTIAFWNGIENRWEMIGSDKLDEYNSSFDADLCVTVRRGTITELGN